MRSIAFASATRNSSASTQQLAYAPSTSAASGFCGDGLATMRIDVLRRALNKYKHDTVEEIRREFFDSAKALGHAEGKIPKYGNW
jgi:hypothetical protein